MKKLLVILGASLMALTVVSTDLLAADGHGLNPYRTPEFIRQPAQMANNTDVMSAVTWNPAGVTKFQDGLYVGLGNIVILKSNEMKVDQSNNTGNGATRTYKQDEPSYLVPTFALAYKTGKAAVFANFEVIDGGGKAIYNDLKADSSKGVGSSVYGLKAEGESSVKQYKVGGSYELTDMFSFTGGVRYVTSLKKAKLTSNGADITVIAAGKFYPANAVIKDEETKMSGQGGFFGININPVKEAVINATFTTKVALQGRTADWLTDKSSEAKDFTPSYFTIGFAYDVMPELKVSVGMNYLFTKEEFRGNAAGNYGYTFQNQKNAKEFAIGADYKANEAFTASAGFAYKMAGGSPYTYMTDGGSTAGVTAAGNPQGISAIQNEATNPDLDLYVIGAGVKVTPVAGLNVNLGIMKAFFKEGKSVVFYPGCIPVKYNRDAWLFGMGVDYKI